LREIKYIQHYNNKILEAVLFRGKKILLLIGGGIAAYKSLELIRLLTRQGGQVRVVLTRAAREFVTPLSTAALSGNKVYSDLFDLTDEAEMGHIQLSRDADLIIVAPATADLMAKAAHGLANDLASTVLLATDTPVLMAPAMNVRMWEHKATRRNLHTLRDDGVAFAGPDEGEMACGEFGPGRMAEPQAILEVAQAMLSGAGGKPSLADRRIIITSGPTREPIDPVRYIANRSSGKQGAALAGALVAQGAEVVFITGPASVPPPPGARLIAVETARDMLREVRAALPADAAVFAAAVADWRVDTNAEQKIKKDGSGAPPTLKLVENPDILATISALPAPERPELVIGFAAETENILANAAAKRARKGCDWIVANDVSTAGGVMGGDENEVHVLDDSGTESWPRLSKTEVARRLARRMAATLSKKAGA
jgi:phosphopantothenoylcysteine decarboxylase/phosphopantothenate--cysteine ligase